MNSEDEQEILALYLTASLRIDAVAAAAAVELGLHRLAEAIAGEREARARSLAGIERQAADAAGQGGR